MQGLQGFLLWIMYTISNSTSPLVICSQKGADLSLTPHPCYRENTRARLFFFFLSVPKMQRGEKSLFVEPINRGQKKNCCFLQIYKVNCTSLLHQSPRLKIKIKMCTFFPFSNKEVLFFNVWWVTVLPVPGWLIFCFRNFFTIRADVKVRIFPVNEVSHKFIEDCEVVGSVIFSWQPHDYISLFLAVTDQSQPSFHNRWSV